ncbi:Methyltransferase type 12 [Chlorobaculum parvum NCIB 8327]|uniref:Methyltransferase type 12 n=1 Tax=Chlorobaculum parvum (strain DSM 263 / NCIMB 8327) TaxID=517417 RepID=B3QM20_CHLP8|nr:50S ribosomal protein L11 methyltransferase [Chlorobaculum parvum]ACF10973.1 Methyltransferase type 12 [Chlorobaculum parvum NCIB 8327]
MPFDRYRVQSGGLVDDELARIRQQLAAEYDLQEVSYRFAESDFSFLSVLDSYALLDRISPEEFVKDEQMPYWAEIWPAAVTLSRQIMETGELAGKSVIELGAGVGIASIAAARSGARVLTTDYSTEALKFVAYNALRNRVDLDTCRLDWRLVKGDEKFDSIIAADVLYERVNLLPIVTAIDALLAEGGSAWIADPRRRLADQFLELVQENGFRISEKRMYDVEGDQTVAVTIYKLERVKA